MSFVDIAIFLENVIKNGNKKALLDELNKEAPIYSEQKKGNF